VCDFAGFIEYCINDKNELKFDKFTQIWKDAMTKKILIVEDHADIRRLVRMTLEFEDFEVYEAADGIAGLALAVQCQPDLLLLDVMMPGGIDGLELCRQLRANPELWYVPIVLLSARGQRQDIEAGAQAGADAYLLKPFSPLDLIDTVRTQLNAVYKVVTS
jgi:two-component system phosphate regulon response regulator PhoB